MSEKLGTKWLKFNQINWTVSNEISPRELPLSQEDIERYSEHLDDEDFPPMVVFYVADYEYILVAGQHRIEAHKLIGRFEAEFIVYSGTLEEAKVFADEDNKKHGLRLRRADMRRVIRHYLMRHSEDSDVVVGKACQTTDKTVRKVREEMEEKLEIPRHDKLKDEMGIWRPRSVPRPGSENDLEPEAEQLTPIEPAQNGPVDVSVSPTPEPPAQRPPTPPRPKPSFEDRTKPCDYCDHPITHGHHMLRWSEHQDGRTVRLCPNCHDLYHVVEEAISSIEKFGRRFRDSWSFKVYQHVERAWGEHHPVLNGLYDLAVVIKSYNDGKGTRTPDILDREFFSRGDDGIKN